MHIGYKVTENSVNEFFLKLNSREDRCDVYNILFTNLLFHLKDDGENFFFTVNNRHGQLVKDINRKLQILNQFKKHFLDVEYYEIMNELDNLIAKHEEEIGESVNMM